MRFMSTNPITLPLNLGDDFPSREKFDHLVSIIKGYPDFCLAFSGGVDSAFLMAAAKVAGLDRILAITIVSQFFTQKEKERAREFASSLGVEHLVLDLDILGQPKVIQNDSKRCYFCKHHAFSMIKAAAEEKGIVTLVHAINQDDLGDYRPGIEAAKELGFKSPLVETGFTKQEIRDCSKKLGLSTWNLPSQSCLATRIPMGKKITEEKLSMIEQAEDVLHDLGLSGVRVRCHGDLARIETGPDGFDVLIDLDVRQKVSSAFKRIGFEFVSLDLGGYISGRMNFTKTDTE